MIHTYKMHKVYLNGQNNTHDEQDVSLIKNENILEAPVDKTFPSHLLPMV
jgi:hypothetical protein